MMRATFQTKTDLSEVDTVLRLSPTYLEKVIIIPQKATYEMQGKTFAYIVADNKVNQQK
jgi:membrane fusion protein (multidrug efflux system)